MIRSVLALPLHAPDGHLLCHLEAVTPKLKTLFGQVYLSVSPPTEAAQGKRVSSLAEDPLFKLNFNGPGSQAGEHFLSAFQSAADNEEADTILHLAGVDRVAFALQTEHEAQFVEDMQSVRSEQTPLFYHRSAYAWSTHPQNYRELEGMITRTGQLLHGQTIDYAWCHMAIRSDALRSILPLVKNRDLSVLAEIAILLQSSLSTTDVDWLAWEDPFIFERNADEFKQEREESLDEDSKRLAYTISALQLLQESATLSGNPEGVLPS